MSENTAARASTAAAHVPAAVAAAARAAQTGQTQTLAQTPAQHAHAQLHTHTEAVAGADARPAEVADVAALQADLNADLEKALQAALEADTAALNEADRIMLAEAAAAADAAAAAEITLAFADAAEGGAGGTAAGKEEEDDDRKGAWWWDAYGNYILGAAALGGIGAVIASHGDGHDGTPEPETGNLHTFFGGEDDVGFFVQAAADDLQPEEISVAASASAKIQIHGGLLTRSEAETGIPLSALQDPHFYDTSIKTGSVAAGNIDHIDAGGVRVHLDDGAHASVAAIASTTSSDILWMRELSITGTTLFLHSAYGNVTVMATAVGNADADAEVGICNITVDLSGLADIHARVDLFAMAASAHQAQVYAGNVTVEASAFSGAAHATGRVFAAATGTGSAGSAGRIEVRDDLNIVADGTTSAEAGLMGGPDILAGAYAFGGNATADVKVGGDLNIHATALNGNAKAYNFGIGAVAEDGGTAGLTIGHSLDIKATADGSGVSASACVSSAMAVVAAGDGSVANFWVNSGINIAAESEGKARAYVGEIGVFAGDMTAGAANAHAYCEVGSLNITADGGEDADAYVEGNVGVFANGTGATAHFVIHDNLDIHATATSGNANAHIGGALGAVATGTSISASARFDVGDNLNITAHGGYSAAAYVSGSIGAYAGGTDANASFTVEGDFNLRATADAHDAYAHAQSFFAHAADAWSAQANVTIGGNLDIAANAGGFASACLESGMGAIADSNDSIAGFKVGNVNITAYGGTGAQAYVSDSIGAFAHGTGASARFDVAHDFNLHATASVSGEADAYVNGSIGAFAGFAATAHFAIHGSLDIGAKAASGAAYAHVRDDIGAEASGAGAAAVFEVGSINIHATASASGDAQAYVSGGIGASASSSSTARLVIHGNLDIGAQAASRDAYAYVSDSIGAVANGTGADAAFEVGNINIHATAQGSNSAYAHAYSLTAYAFGERAQANVTITGNLDIAAKANIGGFASAYLEHGMGAVANSDDSIAGFTVGNVNITAYGGTGAQANVSGNIGAFAGATGTAGAVASASAHFTVAGDFNLHATATTGDARASAGSGIRAYAHGDFYGDTASANVAILGDLDIQAVANSGNANASVFAISASAMVENALANVTLGDIHVKATGFNAQAWLGHYSYTTTSTISGSATNVYHAGGLAAHASAAGSARLTAGDIEVAASAYSFASAYLGVAAVGNSGGNATVTLGNVIVQAESTNDTGYAAASVTASTDSGDTGSSAKVTIDSLKVSATGSDVNGYIGIRADGHGQVEITNDVSLTVKGAYADEAGHLNIFASHSASITVGDIRLTASDHSNIVAIVDASSNNAHIDMGNLYAHAESTLNRITAEINDVSWRANRAAFLSGTGYFDLNLNGDGAGDSTSGFLMVYGTIDLGDAALRDNHVSLDWWGDGTPIDMDFGAGLVDPRDGSGGNIHNTTVKGLDPDSVISISFNDVAMSNSNFAMLTTNGWTNTASMFASINTALDGTVEYVYTVFDEASANMDINHDGDMSGKVGVLAYDYNGVGISGVVFFTNPVAATEIVNVAHYFDFSGGGGGGDGG